jgi:hypothetical protein
MPYGIKRGLSGSIGVHFTERGVHSSGRHVRLLQHHFLELPHEDYLLFGGKIRRMVVRLVQLYVLYGALRRDDRPRVTPQPLVLQAAQVNHGGLPFSDINMKDKSINNISRHVPFSFRFTLHSICVKVKKCINAEVQVAGYLC